MRPASSSFRARKRRHSQGFTLMELLVALVAGLIVSLGVVALSREATNTFHEEQRTSTAEMSLRGAIDRLKSDLQRAGFMATGNIQKDPRIPLDQRGTRVATNEPLLAAIAGIHYEPKGSLAETPLSSVSGNAYEPDSIDITGNFTSSDVYVVSRITPGAGGCNGPRLFLSRDSAASYRVMTSTNPNLTFQTMFQPIEGGAFMVRVADDLGRQEILFGCAAQTAGWDNANGLWVDLRDSAPYLESSYGFVDGRITVNPVQTVRWEIRPLKSTDTTYAAITTDPATTDGGVTRKYNLIRSYVGPNRQALNPAEVVAEYAVDLKFAFSVDLGDYTNTNAPVPSFFGYPFGAAENKTYGQGNTGGARPERIRAVRVRLSTRASIPDRNDDQRLDKNDYTIRYCIEETGCTSGKRQWARVRTVTTEVSLPNQARLFY